MLDIQFTIIFKKKSIWKNLIKIIIIIIIYKILIKIILLINKRYLLIIKKKKLRSKNYMIFWTLNLAILVAY